MLLSVGKVLHLKTQPKYMSTRCKTGQLCFYFIFMTRGLKQRNFKCKCHQELGKCLFKKKKKH